MIQRLFIAFVLLLAAAAAFAQQGAPYAASRLPVNGLYDFATVAGTGYTEYINLAAQGIPFNNHTIELSITGTAPSVCTFQVEGSSNGTNWYSISGSQSCTASEMFHIITKPVRYLQVHVLTYTGTGVLFFQHTGGN
jgi:hypothetical protein